MSENMNERMSIHLPTSSLRVTVFDYGAGNLHSLIKSLETEQTTVRVETDSALAVAETDALILPGVGAFAPAAEPFARSTPQPQHCPTSRNRPPVRPEDRREERKSTGRCLHERKLRRLSK